MVLLSYIGISLRQTTNQCWSLLVMCNDDLIRDHTLVEAKVFKLFEVEAVMFQIVNLK